jgi:hypothetical protein
LKKSSFRQAIGNKIQVINKQNDMKNLKYFLSLFLLTAFLGCSEDENSTDFIDDVSAPANISAIFTITQDNSGNVTIRPNGEGVTSYSVDFGDASADQGVLSPGETIDHTYEEGVYTVHIFAKGINGLVTEYTQQLTVSFIAPENLVVTVAAENGNPYQINVSAAADFETYFEVFFGEDPNETPVQFNEGQTISHTYAEVGTYEVKVIAYSGGAATTEFTQNVTVFDPLLLPLDFESATLNYSFGDFGGSFGSVANNPSASGINTSAKVGKIVKNAGAEVWAGVALALDAPIDFSTLHSISIKSYSPVAGAIVKLKLENLADPNINTEVDAVTTVANGWEILTYNFAGINNANNYQRVVLFYDFGVNGTGASYYFDDVQLSSNAPDLELVNFQDGPYNFTNFGNATTTVVANPDASGINTSTQVAKQNKANGAEVWAGSFLEMPAPIDFSQHSKIKLKVWSPAAGAVIKVKLENLANATINTEVDAVTTVANGWEELTYDFTGIVNANNYQRLVVFCNFGVAGNNANYYFDDIKLSN